MENVKVKLDLSGKEVQTILGVLAKAPYEQSYELIHKIQNQATPQLSEVAPKEPLKKT